VTAVLLANITVGFYITYVDYNNTEHDLIYIQVQPSAVELAERIANATNVIVYEPNNDYWPLPWYLRKDNIPFSSKFYPYDNVVTSEREMKNLLEKGYTLDGRYEIRPGYYMVWLKKD